MSVIGDITWPALIVGVLYYFRDEIRVALTRIREVGMSGVRLDAAVPATQQPTETLTSTTNELISGIKQFISPEQLEPAVEAVKKELEARTQNKDEQIEILIHALASTNIQAAHERTYRVIFGSQMNALVSMNNPGGATQEMLKQIYAAAAAQYPEVYKGFPFESWISYLVSSGLAVHIDNRYETTPYGRGFLKYIVDLHLVTPKPF